MVSDLAWFSSLSFERLCIFGLHGAIYNFWLHLFRPIFFASSLVGVALNVVD